MKCVLVGPIDNISRHCFKQSLDIEQAAEAHDEIQSDVEIFKC